MLWFLFFLFVNYKFSFIFNCQQVLVLVSNFSTVKVGQLDSVSWVRLVLQLAPGWFVPLVLWVYPERFETRSPSERNFVAVVHSFGSSYSCALCLIIIKIVYFTLVYNTILYTHLGCKRGIFLYISIPLLGVWYLIPRWLLWLDSLGQRHYPV